MAAQLGGHQISALLQSLPGIASVLRSPVADAIVSMIRAGAGLGDFHESDANELVQHAVRRGLLGSEEGEELLADIRGVGKKSRAKTRAKKTVKKAAASKRPGTGKKKSAPAAKKAVKKVTAKKATKTVKRKAVKSTAKKVRKKR
jgi:polyhydroxyalkanoate synthesis regulator phasin